MARGAFATATVAHCFAQPLEAHAVVFQRFLNSRRARPSSRTDAAPRKGPSPREAIAEPSGSPYRLRRNRAQMQEQVYWYTRRSPHDVRSLSGDVRADVVVVGGGVAGLSCAQRLLAAGLSVAVVESDFCGAGASGKSSGFVTPASEIQLASLISTHGPVEARRIWEFVSSGVEAIRSNVLEQDFDCEYQVQDSLFAGNEASGWRAVQQEHHARVELGYPSRLYDATTLEDVLPTTRYSGAMRFGATFSIDAFAYCQELRDLLEARGAAIYEASRVTRLRREGVQTAGGSVQAERVVVCTDRFIPDLGALQSDIYHVQTFLAVSAPLSDSVVQRLFPTGLAMTWDSDLIYHYFRMIGRDRILLGGGDLLHTYARSPARDLAPFARRALDYFHAKFPNVALNIEYVWPGMLGVSKDLLPVMGRDRTLDTIWYAGAATGLPWAAALGIYAAERILSGRSDFDRAFSPERKFVIGRRLQGLLSTPLAYAVSHGIVRRS